MRAAIFHEPGNIGADVQGLTEGELPKGELSRLGAVEEVQIAAVRGDGTAAEPRSV